MKKHINFEHKSMTYRKKKWWNLHERFKRENIIYDSHDCSFENNPNAQWWDFTFLGKKKGNIYHCCICTANEAFMDKVEEIISDKVWNMLTPEEYREEIKLEGRPCKFDKFGKPTMYEWISKDIHYDKFGGLTIYEYMNKLKLELIENDPPKIYPYIKPFNAKYAYGLNVVVDAERIDDEVVRKFIKKFYDNNEYWWYQNGDEYKWYQSEKMANIKYTTDTNVFSRAICIDT